MSEIIPEAHKANLEAIRRAARDGDLALVYCDDVRSGRPIVILAAIGLVDGEYQIVPLAKMFDGDPYEELRFRISVYPKASH